MKMLSDLPLNTDNIYVMAKTKNGCEVYAPILATDNAQEKKKQLQKELDNAI